MKQITFDTTKYFRPTTNSTNERSSLIEPFVTKLNESRVASGYKPLSASFYASKMSHIATDELEFHYKQLSQSKNFSALWWWTNCPKKK